MTTVANIFCLPSKECGAIASMLHLEEKLRSTQDDPVTLNTVMRGSLNECHLVHRIYCREDDVFWIWLLWPGLTIREIAKKLFRRNHDIRAARSRSRAQ